MFWNCKRSSEEEVTCHQLQVPLVQHIEQEKEDQTSHSGKTGRLTERQQMDQSPVETMMGYTSGTSIIPPSSISSGYAPKPQAVNGHMNSGTKNCETGSQE